MPRPNSARRMLNTPRRRKVDETRRSDLLASVEAIFLDEGFTHVTMGELTERLHCSKATLYSVAPTKEQLVIAATKKFFAKSAEIIEDTVADLDSPSAKVSAYLDGVATAMRRNSRDFYEDMVSFSLDSRNLRAKYGAGGPAGRRAHR
ncbi:TetR/AcrR family transcriptional regulator [Nocardia sp. NPDC005366]|uniref:TetR/AcrR family transcriptional regulator n=1 Tax=Nocardia sp. NPDC005366 TaxID=3156878 RepID=UPI0033B38172